MHKERVPHATAGFQRSTPPPLAGVLSASAWKRGPLLVISAVELAEYPDGSGIGPQWHLSLSVRRARPSDRELRRVVRAFALPSPYDEDNHHPGIARHVWCPIDPARRVTCQCKAEERTVVEPDGYRWTTPRDEREGCRGCEYEQLTRRPCPFHRAQDTGATAG